MSSVGRSPRITSWIAAAAVLLASDVSSQTEEEIEKARQELMEQLHGSMVRAEVDGVRLVVEGLDEARAMQLAGLVSTMRDAMYAESENDLFSGDREVRVRLRGDQAWNHYCGGVAAVTLVVPDPACVLEGQGHSVAQDFLELAMEAQWSRIVRPVWSMPAVVRNAMNRVLVEHYMGTLVAELGDEWWFGEAPPSGTTWGLPNDASFLRQRDALAARLRAVIAREGFGAILVALNHWNAVRMTGQEAAQHLEALVQESEAAEAKEKAAAVGEAGSEERTPVPLLPEVHFRTREPWTRSGFDDDRLDGVQFSFTRNAGARVRFWYGENQDLPEKFVSVKSGAPTLALRVPSSGIWKFAEAEVVLRRTGDFEPDATFSVLILNPAGHELFRWNYLLHQLPEVADWLVLENTAKPQVAEEFLVAFEFPPMAEGQDVEIGVWPGAEAEHCFWSVPGVSVRGLGVAEEEAEGEETEGDEAAEFEAEDFAAVIQVSAAQVNPRHVNRMVMRALEGL